MNRKERLTATLQGHPVDRPPVNFYEIDGVNQDESDPDPFNIYSDPSWAPLLRLAREHSDAIAGCPLPVRHTGPDPLEALEERQTWIDEQGRRFTRRRIRAGRRTLTETTRRDPDVNTVWTIEHLLKDEEDFLAWLDLPESPADCAPDLARLEHTERRLGDTGIAMINCSDPLCGVAGLFSMETYTVLALTRPDLMRHGLDRMQRGIMPRIETAARAAPGRLWRIVGPEYAAPPYLPPTLFREYVVPYDRAMVETIHRHGGYARLHSHGRLRDVLDAIVATGCMGLDPIEPPPQGDMQLAEVRERYGDRLVLFGNLEASDIENLDERLFGEKVRRALDEGGDGAGRGFVLMPSACPYGRRLSARARRNYEVMIEAVVQARETVDGPAGTVNI